MTVLRSINKLRTIFERKDWDLENPIYADKFEKYCSLFRILTDEEQDIIMILTENYLHCPSKNYFGILAQSFKLINTAKYESYNDIYILPLIDPHDKNKIKSSNTFSYAIAYEYVPALFNSDNARTHLIPKPNSLISKRDKRNKGLFIFVDDFIGTGDTASAAITNYRNFISVNSDSVIIIALVSLETGYNRIKNLVNDLYVPIIVNKGIADSSTFTDKSKTYSIMEKIESRLKDQQDYKINDYKFGYRRSEALVTMIRTPDNTFPVFWWSESASGEKWPSPFRRV